MIEFDPLGTDLFDNMRGIFDQAFDQDIFKKKATWVISDIKHFEMLENRYVLGQFGNVMGAATPGDLHYWKSDSSYKPNIEFGAYGLNGIIFYTGTADLVLKYPDPGRGIGPFRGKCTIYATEANIILEDLKLERREEDVLTVITLKDVEIKGGTDPVEVAIAAVGSESKFKNPTERAIFGNVVLKRYTVDQNKSQAESLQGDLEYNEMLDAGSRDDPRGNHLFVSISPYRLAQDMDVTE